MSSKIKGGGRAIMSEESQEALVDLLISIDCEQSGSDVPEMADLSLHDRKRTRKQFVKKLVRRHERTQLKQKYGTAAPSQRVNQGRGEAHMPELASSNANVRIELAEAIFAKDKGNKKDKRKNKDDKEKSKKKSFDDGFKIGAKKVLVVTRSTNISDLLKLAQSKLKIKKKPVCAFLQPSASVIFELKNDLPSISDGTVIYVSATSLPVDNQSDDETDNDEEEQDEVDPLESVKRAYEKQDMSRRQQRCKIMPDVVIDEERRRHEETRSKLPVASYKQDILDTISNAKVTILVGSTGSGKSTQVPQYLLENKEKLATRKSYIVVTQPRRVAAISLAQRVSDERGSPPPGSKGSSVGYIVRLDNQVDLRSCRIVYMTIGILLRMLVQHRHIDDKEQEVDEDVAPPISIDTISHLIIDETHERDTNTDFVLTLLKGMMSSKSCPAVDLPRLILMSATASADLFMEYFTISGKSSPAIIEIPGRTYPVDIKWLRDCEKFTGKRLMTRQGSIDKLSRGRSDAFQDKNCIVLSPRARDRIDYDFISALISKILHETPDGYSSGAKMAGSVLVFLPGLSEINALARCLKDDESITGDVLTLHSSTSKYDQARVFYRSTKSKIILSTNIAETSLTIPDVSHVIDTCLVKESRYNSESSIKELTTVWTSYASMTQRTGRAGRTSHGTCWRLCSEEFAAETMLKNTLPEIVRAPLDELILQVCLLYEKRRDKITANDSDNQLSTGVKPIKFLSSTPTPPPERNYIQACRHLVDVGALSVVQNEQTNDSSSFMYRLTPLGYHLSRLPMDAKVGKLLVIGCILGCLENALTIAAALSCSKSCFLRSSREQPLDTVRTDARDNLIENGFGGRDWSGGTAKGDLIAVIAAYRTWKQHPQNSRSKFCWAHALDNFAIQELDRLREQFGALVIDAGFSGDQDGTSTTSNDDALLTSCCLVAGLYPNICTLIRPNTSKGGNRIGKLLTKDNDLCRPSSESFQAKRVKNASKAGRDAYAVYFSKHQSIGAASQDNMRPPEIFLSEVNFVSKFNLLLFGGQLELVNNALIIDRWLKFKVSGDGEKSKSSVVNNAVLILSLRSLLNDLMTEHIQEIDLPPAQKRHMTARRMRVINVVRKMISDES